MSLKIAQKGGIQLTAPQKESASFTDMQYRTPERNTFNLSKQTHGSMRFGKIYPVYSRMLMPGDSFKVRPSHFIRFASVLSPVLNRINISYAAFYVPFRLVWKFWPTFISGGYNNDGVYTDQSGNYLNENDNYSGSPFKPQIPVIDMLFTSNSSDYVFDMNDGSLADWLGFPSVPDGTNREELNMSSVRFFNALPFMCYQRVINDWFTNPNIKDENRRYATPSMNVSGILAANMYPDVTKLAYINYGLDYFTSCLPYLQRGNPMLLNRATEDNLSYKSSDGKGTPVRYSDGSAFPNVGSSDGDLVAHVFNSSDDTAQLGFQSSDGNYGRLTLDVSSNLSLSLTTTIQELRYVNAIQRWQEKSLRIGTRYIDFLKCYFGVKSSDQSLQRSEYLGGFVSEVQKADIDQTSATDYSNNKSTPQGTTTSKLISADQSKPFTCFAEEHGMLFVMAIITPETIYKNRFKTEYLYTEKEDYLWPEFTHLSPQAVRNCELWFPRQAPGSSYIPLGTFGYQDRYNELRCDMNDVHGDFKGSLAFFLQQRDFSQMPALNTSFLQANNVDTSIFATDKVIDSDGKSYEVDQIWASFDFDVKAVRCLPKLATPSLI